jgi:hypothetical protein
MKLTAKDKEVLANLHSLCIVPEQVWLCSTVNGRYLTDRYVILDLERVPGALRVLDSLKDAQYELFRTKEPQRIDFAAPKVTTILERFEATKEWEQLSITPWCLADRGAVTGLLQRSSGGVVPVNRTALDAWLDTYHYPTERRTVTFHYADTFTDEKRVTVIRVDVEREIGRDKDYSPIMVTHTVGYIMPKRVKDIPTFPVLEPAATPVAV